MTHSERQRDESERAFAAGSRAHVSSEDDLVRYLTRWRLIEAMRRLREAAKSRLGEASTFLALCAGEGLEGSVLCDLGYCQVTVSDLSPAGVRAALARDQRLSGVVLDAERLDLPSASYDVVVVQDGLHHLQAPVGGFVEMLRVCRVAAILLEPHDSFVGKRIGTKWEQNGEAVTHVFRWSKKLVCDVADSYLGRDAFDDLSFSFWHHNVVLDRAARRIGGGAFGMTAVKVFKRVMDAVAADAGNQFCGLVLKR